jgi:hypothetical protein
MTEQKALNKNFLIAAVLGLGILSGVIGYFYAGKTQIIPVKTEAKIVTFQGFPEGTKAKAEINLGGKISPIDVEGGQFLLSDKQLEEFAAPYVISATFQYPDGSYRDFSWTLESNGAWYDFLADGFRPTDKIVFSANNFVGKEMSFDWSGKLAYPLVLEVNQDFKICFDITETPANRKLSLCQFKSGMKQG